MNVLVNFDTERSLKRWYLFTIHLIYWYNAQCYGCILWIPFKLVPWTLHTSIKSWILILLSGIFTFIRRI